MFLPENSLHKKTSFLFLSLLLFSGCSSGGGGAPSELSVTGFSQSSFEHRTVLAFARESRFNPFNPPATPLANLPSGNSAPSVQYNGHIRGELSDGELNGRRIIGDLGLQIDFASSTVFGSAGNFEDDAGTILEGSVSGSTSLVMNSSRDRAEIIPTLSGTIRGLESNIALDGVIAGGVYEAVSGLALGSIGSSRFDGAFVAER